MDEVQPIFLSYLKALNLLSVTVFDYLPQQSTVMWKSPAAVLGPQTDQGKPNTRRDLLPSLLCIGCQSAMVLRANPNIRVPVALQRRSQASQAVQLQRMRKQDWDLRRSGLTKTRSPREVETYCRSCSGDYLHEKNS